MDVVSPTQVIVRNMTEPTTDGATLSLYAEYEEFEYEDGQEIPQMWNPVFVIFAYLLACVSAYSAVHLLDHSMWRATAMKERAEIATSIHHPDVWAACLLAFGSVWCMHFVGMAAVTLRGVPICYNWGQTMGSLAVVVVLMIGGIKVAGNDIFATSKRGKILKDILGNKYMSDTEAMWAITRIVMFHKLHWLFLGSLMAALGALVMHYTGMMSQRGPFTKQWNAGYVAASVLAGVIICFVGFWIIFRLRWKVKQFWLRYLSAAVISAAVCFLHFFGMLGATYYADYTKLDTCQGTWEASNKSPSAWTAHQIVVCGISILLPSIALYIENLISKELILTYDVTESDNAQSAMNSRFADDKSKLKNFLSSNNSRQSRGDNNNNNSSVYDDSDHDLDDPHNLNAIIQSKPIADLFPNTSILVANITGFTAWSSMREPAQVFMLLETIYQSFNKIVKTYNVHKIESTGDQYVVVAGLPEPRKDHASVLCRVARECVTKMRVLTQKLEVILGPDTGDLNIRIGIHSGPVTAGVLRGDRATFQLFGDTMNLANRMESTGSAGKVHVSSDTAELLKQGGKGKWVKPREDQVFVKGKGLVQCYWLRNIGIPSNPDEEPTNFSHSVSTTVAAAGDEYYRLNKEKTDRLIHWNVETLVRVLKEIVARRNAMQECLRNPKRKSSLINRSRHSTVLTEDSTVIDEVCEIIDLPQFDFEMAKQQKDPDSIVIPEKVVHQLKDYVTCLAELYQSNPFHNFEHASHVAMSVTKLLSRIVAHSSEMRQDANKSVGEVLHENTFGITSDPLTQFACILASLMHDADHQGVPNSQLIKEGAEIAQIYKNKSVAEQNSVDLAWEHLMDDKYEDLRATIYSNEEEMRRFRQLIVNSIMATDIMDKDLKQLRNDRWDKAFSVQHVEEDPHKTKNRKATIVIEHLIQASDVAHTMQHWHVYTKWNQCLFEEMYKAFKEGRAEKDPSEFWYKGEIGFFDFYIIPLAKKLKDCGVFGVSSDEYLNYALQNRKEWEACGEKRVAEMVEKVQKVWAEIEANDAGIELADIGDDIKDETWSVGENDKEIHSGNTAEDTDPSDY